MQGVVGATFGAWSLAWILGAVFLAGLLRGYTGFGFAIAAVPPAAAVPIVLALQAIAGFGDFARALVWRGSVQRLGGCGRERYDRPGRCRLGDCGWAWYCG